MLGCAVCGGAIVGAGSWMERLRPITRLAMLIGAHSLQGLAVLSCPVDQTTFPQEVTQCSPHLCRVTPLRDGLDGPQAVAVISVPFTAWRARALATVETAPAILHGGLAAY